MLAAALVMIPTVWLPDVKTLSYLGFAGVAGTLSVAATVGSLNFFVIDVLQTGCSAPIPTRHWA